MVLSRKKTPFNDADYEILAQYIRYAADSLNLKDWNIELDNTAPDNSSVLAESAIFEKGYRTIIRLCHEFRVLPDDEQRETIVHELLHVHTKHLFDDMYSAVDEMKPMMERIFNVRVERLIDTLSRTFKDILEPIKWSNTEKS